MKKIFIALTAASFFLASCNSNKTQTNGADSTAEVSATDSVSAEDAPVIKFEKNSYDFGKITDGEKVSYDFAFTNTGKSPLIISNATASCGCTVPEFPHEPIPPGGKSAVKVVFNSEGKSGMQNKVVTITANTVPATTEVYLVGEVAAKK